MGNLAPLANALILIGASIVAAHAAGSIARLVKNTIGADDDMLSAHAINLPPTWRWATGLAVGLLAATFIASGAQVDAFSLMFFVMLLLAIALVDLETTFVPDALSVPLLLGGVAFSPFNSGPYDGAIGAFAGWGVMAATFFVVSLRRREVTYSGGDALLAGAGGAIVGAAGVPPFLFLSGLLMLIVFARPGADDRRLPWGPVICASIALTAAADLGAYFKIPV